MKERLYATEMYEMPEYRSRKFKYVILSNMVASFNGMYRRQVSEYSFWHFRCLVLDPAAMLLEDMEVDAEL